MELVQAVDYKNYTPKKNTGNNITHRHVVTVTL